MDTTCRTCGHEKSEHANGVGRCSHVKTGAALIGCSDVICGCWIFVPDLRDVPGGTK
jgi:hypothetical protein